MSHIESTAFRFRCSPELKTALEAKAAEETISASAFVRRALKRSLQVDGVIIMRPTASRPTESATA